MAKLNQGILGGISGKIGNVIGSSWKGIAVIKSKPLSVANPKTAAQVAQRTKMSAIVLLAQTILAPVIKPLWDRFASKMSGYNAFISSNIEYFSDLGVLTFASLKISKGKMSATVSGGATAGHDPANLSWAWDDDSGEGYKLATDVPFVVVINENTGDVFGIECSQTRADEYAQFDIPTAQLVGHTLHCYLAFRRADGTVVSETTYEEVTVE